MSAHSFAPEPGSGAESVASASGVEFSTQARNPPSSSLDNFLRDHLTVQPQNYDHDHAYWHTKLPKIQGCTGLESNIYKPICNLLNTISRWTYKYYRAQKAELPYDDPVVFLDHHSTAPTHGLDGKPDIIAIFASKKVVKSHRHNSKGVYSGVPSYHVASVGECKPDAKPGNPQAIRYTWQLLQARPDMPGVYGLCANSKEYCIIWSDPSGPVISPLVQWKNLYPLEAYIRSLYVPPKGHHLWDPTITCPALLFPTDTAGPQKKKPHWTIKYGDKVYKDCNQIHTGDSWSRRTTVFMYDTDSGDFAVIKDAYRDDRRRFEEAALLDHIHSKGTFPGVVRVITSGEVDGQDGSSISTARPAVAKKVVHRTKKRIVMGSRGSQLSAAKSVRDLLMTVYDGTEVLRALVNQRDYLHRDVSFYNFLIYPEHKEGTLAEGGFIENPPVFIRDILGTPKRENEDNCCALLIDADNSALLIPTDATTLEAVYEELAARTGTPRYIARAVSKGKLLVRGASEARTFSPMPVLTGKAKDAYIAAYGQDMYDLYTDIATNTHGGKYRGLPSNPPHWSHRPDHDVESMFWVLLYAVVLAKPLGAADEPSQLFADACDIFQGHTIVVDQGIDRRSTLLTSLEEDWLDMLHPKLSPIVPMMMRLAEQVKPEYGFLDVPPEKDHLHEAFRRILLEQILSMEDDPIPLTPNVSRKPPTTELAGQEREARMDASIGVSGSKKRKAEDDGKAGCHKSARSCTDGVASHSLHCDRYMND